MLTACGERDGRLFARPWARLMTFSRQIFAGLALGILTGVFFGERAAVLKWAADGFVKLLQMMVLPYITVSIVASLGSLRRAELRILGVRAAAVIGGLWLLALTFAFLIPLTFPVGAERVVFQLEPDRAASGVRFRRPVHSCQPVQLPRQQHRPGSGAVLAVARDRAGRGSEPGAIARRAAGRS